MSHQVTGLCSQAALSAPSSGAHASGPLAYRRLAVPLPAWMMEILQAVRTVFPAAVLAGGAVSAILMRHLDGREQPASMADLESSDLDFFVPMPHSDISPYGVAYRVKQIPGAADLDCPDPERLSGEYPETLVSTVTTCRINDVRCQVIIHRGDIARRTLEFDFTIRQCYHDGDALWVTEQGMQDLQSRTLRIANPFRPLRALRRAARFVRQYGLTPDPLTLAITLDVLRHSGMKAGQIRAQLDRMDPEEAAWLSRYVSVTDSTVSVHLPAALPGTPEMRRVLYDAALAAPGIQSWLMTQWLRTPVTESGLTGYVPPDEGEGAFAWLTGTTYTRLPFGIADHSLQRFTGWMQQVSWDDVLLLLEDRKRAALRARVYRESYPGARLPESGSWHLDAKATRSHTWRFGNRKIAREVERLRGIIRALQHLPLDEYWSGRLKPGQVPHWESPSVAKAIRLLRLGVSRWLPEEGAPALAVLDEAEREFHRRHRGVRRLAITISTRWEDLLAPVRLLSRSGSLFGSKLAVAHLAADLEPGRTAIAFVHEPDAARWMGYVVLRALEGGGIAVEPYRGIRWAEPILARALGERLAQAERLPGAGGVTVPFTWAPPMSEAGTVKIQEDAWESRITYTWTVPPGWSQYSEHFAAADRAGSAPDVRFPPPRWAQKPASAPEDDGDLPF